MADYRDYAVEERAERVAVARIAKKVRAKAKELQKAGFTEDQATAIAEAIPSEIEEKYFLYRDRIRKKDSS